MLFQTCDPHKSWHVASNNVRIAVINEDDSHLSLGVEILQTLVLELRGIVHEEDHMISFV